MILFRGLLLGCGRDRGGFRVPADRPRARPKRRRMRIVSLLPSATEILFVIGAGERVVGVTHECDFPPEARSRPALTSSLLPQELDAAGIDRHVRGWDKPSDHVPVWADLAIEA